MLKYSRDFLLWQIALPVSCGDSPPSCCSIPWQALLSVLSSDAVSKRAILFYFFNQPDLVMYFLVRAALERKLLTCSTSSPTVFPAPSWFLPPHLLQNKQTYTQIYALVINLLYLLSCLHPRYIWPISGVNVLQCMVMNFGWLRIFPLCEKKLNQVENAPT